MNHHINPNPKPRHSIFGQATFGQHYRIFRRQEQNKQARLAKYGEALVTALEVNEEPKIDVMQELGLYGYEAILN